MTGDVAVRRDMFNRFKDATSVRASLLAAVGGGFALAGSYAEGIAQPTFFDLYGFFPNNFMGNPALKPESSRGFEGIAALPARADRRIAHRLTDSGCTTRSSTSSTSPTSCSARAIAMDVAAARGIEAELRLEARRHASAVAQITRILMRPSRATASGAQVRELRRPKHSGSMAADGTIGRLTYGASLAYVGRHFDQRDTFPFDRVSLGSYWLADARVAYAIRPGVELFARSANAAQRSRYQDVFGYRTEPPGPASRRQAGRIGDHRREVRLGSQLAVDARTTGELADAWRASERIRPRA